MVFRRSPRVFTADGPALSFAARGRLKTTTGASGRLIRSNVDHPTALCRLVLRRKQKNGQAASNRPVGEEPR